MLFHNLNFFNILTRLTFTKFNSRSLCSGSCGSKCKFKATELKMEFRASNASILSTGFKIGDVDEQITLDNSSTNGYKPSIKCL